MTLIEYTVQIRIDKQNHLDDNQMDDLSDSADVHFRMGLTAIEDSIREKTGEDIRIRIFED